MLEITQRAIDAIKHVAPDDVGLRIYLAAGPSDLELLQVEIASDPEPEDEVLESEGVQVFLEPKAAETLDDMILDAKHEDDGVRFAVSRGR